jgi:MSHA biogenesis protein MshM
MYHDHFGLREAPFTITPDTNFFFAHSSHLEALNTLLVAARSGEGFMKVVGEVGTGKTLLCRKFLAALEGESFVTAYIPNPYVGPNTLLLAVADELGVVYPARVNQHQLLKEITRFLIDTSAAGRQVVVCLDEAQAMPVETLEALRLLTNLETERRKLLQVVLFGQPELDVKLEEARIRQLKQRITFSCRLQPFNRPDVEYYLQHRMTVAGYSGAPAFDDGATRRIHRASGGVPRLINILAHKALMAAFGEGVHRVGERHVRVAIADTESVPVRKGRHRRLWRAFGVAAGVAGVCVGTLLWIGIA